MQSAPPPLPQPSQLPPLADQSSLEAPPYAPAYGGHSEWPLPTLSLRISDLAHPGVAIFFGSVDPPEALKRAVMASFVWLYGSPEASPAQSVTLWLWQGCLCLNASAVFGLSSLSYDLWMVLHTAQDALLTQNRTRKFISHCATLLIAKQEPKRKSWEFSLMKWCIAFNITVVALHLEVLSRDSRVCKAF